ncbi:MAG: UDP-glucose--hexose-1-phosphate uridylyltransferase [Anaerolineaceae bacterium]|nr:UDP-glucose--hexose-1-phosphate uridylyltransferase [Anaerolineaceae bacterium]
MFDTPHRRFNPLTREWVLVSPHRAKRPWQGQVSKVPADFQPTYDPSCYLCPGNERAGGVNNPDYKGTFTFDNDFAALLPEVEQIAQEAHPLFVTEPESGICRVICFSPRHDLTLPQLSLDEAEQVINIWSDQTEEIFKNPKIAYVQVFENKGAQMGCSNPHPHSQIWAQSRIPNEPEKELAAQKAYFMENHRPLLLDYLAEEQQRQDRIIASNKHFTALVPFWAIWPFEVMVVAHRAVSSLPALLQVERRALAELFQQVTIAYDNLFEISFPYSMGFHQSPNDQQAHPEWVLHAHFYPPLLRSATVKKFMVGYELLAMPQRDITAEIAAVRLRDLPKIHYTKR